MNETILSLLLKIKALAERGVDGERKTAEMKLIALMKKYRIKPADLEAQDEVSVMFKYRTAHEKLLGIILGQFICGRRDVPCRTMPKKRIEIFMTKAQAKEWKAMYAHYRSSMHRDEAMFIAAFCHRNEILPPKDGTPRKDLSPEQISAILKMMAYMERSPYVKMSTLIGAFA